jgi:hypothetical protein
VPAAPRPTHYLVAVGLGEQLRRLGHAVIGNRLRQAAAAPFPVGAAPPATLQSAGAKARGVTG